jgi:hypothetical protein
MLYLIYKITNNINGKIYVGAHVTQDINDGYMGSGHALKRAKKKYGIEHFSKEILYIFNNETAMWDEEKKIVNEEFCNRKDTYNVRVGGIGGWNHYNGSIKHKESSRRGGKKSAKRLNEFIAKQKESNTEWWQSWKEKNKLGNRNKNSNGWSNLSDEGRQKRKLDISKKMSGDGNSQYGRIWISNIKTKEVKRVNINDQIPNDWVRGKKGYIASKVWVNNNIQEHFILIKNYDLYLEKGFIKGRLKKSIS